MKSAKQDLTKTVKLFSSTSYKHIPLPLGLNLGGKGLIMQERQHPLNFTVEQLAKHIYWPQEANPAFHVVERTFSEHAKRNYEKVIFTCFELELLCNFLDTFNTDALTNLVINCVDQVTNEPWASMTAHSLLREPLEEKGEPNGMELFIDREHPSSLQVFFARFFDRVNGASMFLCIDMNIYSPEEFTNAMEAEGVAVIESAISPWRRPYPVTTLETLEFYLRSRNCKWE